MQDMWHIWEILLILPHMVSVYLRMITPQVIAKLNLSALGIGPDLRVRRRQKPLADDLSVEGKQLKIQTIGSRQELWLYRSQEIVFLQMIRVSRKEQ